MHFHNSRHINPRHGHIVLKEGQTHYRWCFSDSTTTQAFVEQFDGEISQPKAARTDQEKKNDRELDRSYESTIKGRPDAKQNSDPWADVRPAPPSTAKNKQK